MQCVCRHFLFNYIVVIIKFNKSYFKGSKSLSSETLRVNVEDNKSVSDLQMSSEIPNSAPTTQAETDLCFSAKPGNFDELHKPVKGLSLLYYVSLLSKNNIRKNFIVFK